MKALSGFGLTLVGLSFAAAAAAAGVQPVTMEAMEAMEEVVVVAKYRPDLVAEEIVLIATAPVDLLLEQKAGLTDRIALEPEIELPL